MMRQQRCLSEFSMRMLLVLLWLWAALASAGVLEAPPHASGVLGFGQTPSANFLPVRQAFSVRLATATPQEIQLQFVIAEGYYLYRQRLHFSTNREGVSVRVLAWPDALVKEDPYFGSVPTYRGVLALTLALDNPTGQPFEVRVSYQGCADQGLCYPPEEESIPISGTADPRTTPKAKDSPSFALKEHSPQAPHSLFSAGDGSWKSILLFFLAGLGLTLTPCVLPMLPIVSSVVVQAQSGGRRSLLLSWVYVCAMSLSFALLGVLTGLFGAEFNLQSRLQSPWFLGPFAVFFGLLALAMFGVFELRLPRWVSEPLDRLSRRRVQGSLTGAALLGVLSSLLVSPCVSAPLAGALLYISGTGDALGGGLKLFFLGLGMGAPLILLAVGWGRFLPKTGAWMLGVRYFFGVLLLAVAIWMLERVVPAPVGLLLWGSLAVGVSLFLGVLEQKRERNAAQRLVHGLGLLLLVYGLSCWVGAWQGHANPLQPLASDAVEAPSSVTASWHRVETSEALMAQLNAAQTAKQPVVLDWYADWCVSCSWMERFVFTQEAVLARWKGYRLVRVDVTENTANQRALLDRFKIFGPPALVFLDAQGQEWVEARILGEADADHIQHQMDYIEQHKSSPLNAPPSSSIAL